MPRFLCGRGIGKRTSLISTEERSEFFRQAHEQGGTAGGEAVPPDKGPLPLFKRREAGRGRTRDKAQRGTAFMPLWGTDKHAWGIRRGNRLAALLKNRTAKPVRRQACLAVRVSETDRQRKPHQSAARGGVGGGNPPTAIRFGGVLLIADRLRCRRGERPKRNEPRTSPAGLVKGSHPAAGTAWTQEAGAGGGRGFRGRGVSPPPASSPRSPVPRGVRGGICRVFVRGQPPGV